MYQWYVLLSTIIMSDLSPIFTPYIIKGGAGTLAQTAVCPLHFITPVLCIRQVSVFFSPSLDLLQFAWNFCAAGVALDGQRKLSVAAGHFQSSSLATTPPPLCCLCVIVKEGVSAKARSQAQEVGSPSYICNSAAQLDACVCLHNRSGIVGPAQALLLPWSPGAELLPPTLQCAAIIVFLVCVITTGMVKPGQAP